ncbi:hypothetical protein [uncultured Maritimibacter sp.]|jgi:hypothetical protein|uniref:hypothetical protein n=1 Tax=uncultured Maritimibacter sp. TaxID=991866 RepID=UPI00260B4A19|nr:hypothetical protein [uncultured Maritimibacter sp.]
MADVAQGLPKMTQQDNRTTVKLDDLTGLYGRAVSPDFGRIFRESRSDLAQRHRKMASEQPGLIRRWRDGRFELVEA